MEGAELGIDVLGGLRLIGRGASTAVYQAHHRRLGPVAVKVTDQPVDPDAHRTFATEWERLQPVSEAANLVTLYEQGRTPDGRLFVVTEYIDGGSLAAVVRRGPTPPAEAIELMLGVCEGLGWLHHWGAVHGDIKPSSIMLDRRVPKLADVGMTRFRSTRAVGAAVPDALIESWQHLAPDAVGGRWTVSSDLYAVSATLYTLVAGRPPFSQPGGDDMQRLMARIVRDLPPSLDPALGRPDLDGAFRQLLAKDPARRPSTVEGLETILRALASGPVVTGRKRRGIRRPPPGTPPPLPRGARSGRTGTRPRPVARSSARLAGRPSRPPTGVGASTGRGFAIGLFVIACVFVVLMAITALLGRMADDGDSGGAPVKEVAPAARAVDDGSIDEVVTTTTAPPPAPLSFDAIAGLPLGGADSPCPALPMADQGALGLGNGQFVELWAGVCYRWTHQGEVGRALSVQGFANDGDDIRLALTGPGAVAVEVDENLDGQFQERIGGPVPIDENGEYLIWLIAVDGDGGPGGVVARVG